MAGPVTDASASVIPTPEETTTVYTNNSIVLVYVLVPVLLVCCAIFVVLAIALVRIILFVRLLSARALKHANLTTESEFFNSRFVLSFFSIWYFAVAEGKKFFTYAKLLLNTVYASFSRSRATLSVELPQCTEVKTSNDVLDIDTMSYDVSFFHLYSTLLYRINHN